MEDFIDRLADLLKSLLGRGLEKGRDAGQPGGPRARPWSRPGFTDPDLSEAWEELEDYMRGGRESSGRGRRSADSGRAPGPVDEDLRQDYANLEVPFGSDIEVVKRAYKSLIMRYHPDKHSGDPEKLRIATEISAKINESYERIRSRTEGRRRPP
jgi:hypothetical protein